MVLEAAYTRAKHLERSDLQEVRDAVLTGPVDLRVEATTVTGTVHASASAATLATASGPVLQHAWGTMVVTVGETVCRGSFAWSYYDEPPESGGSMHLKCDDESVLSASIAPWDFQAPNYEHALWRLYLDVQDGWWAGRGHAVSYFDLKKSKPNRL